MQGMNGPRGAFVPRMRFTLAALLASACSLNKAAIHTSTALLACDWGQTRGAARAGWPGGTYESNVILGEHPTARQVDAYFAAAIAIDWLLFYLTPPRWRALGQAGIIGVEAWAVSSNWRIDGMGRCGQ